MCSRVCLLISPCMENLQRQLDELQALGAMYPEDEGCFLLQPAEKQAIALAAAAVDAAAGGQLSQDFYVSNLTGTITLPDVQLAGEPVALRFQLPAMYPADAAAQVTVVCSAPRSLHEQLSAAMTAAAQTAVGSESLLLLLDALQAEVARVNESIVQQQQQQQRQQQAEHPGPPDEESHSLQLSLAHACQNCVLRTVMWFHHIKSSQKRKHLVAWARELGIGGFSKPGFPGIVIAEGSISAVRVYVARIRALQWQAMQVRGEELVRCASHVHVEPECVTAHSDTSRQYLGSKENNVAGCRTLRGFQGQFGELPESGMSELAKYCKDAGMEDLFLAALKLAK